jgi:hypothetical protein
VLHPADRGSVHAVEQGKIHAAFTPRQGHTDLPDLSILDLRTRMTIAPQSTTVANAVSRVGPWVAHVQVAGQVVSLVIISMAHDLFTL